MALPPALKLFLQNCLGERFATEDKLKQLLEDCCAQDSDSDVPSKWVDTVAKINKDIIDFGLELRRGLDQETGATLWALVNTSEDDIAEMATNYTPGELVYFKALLEAIITSGDENFYIKQSEALHLSLEKIESLPEEHDEDHNIPSPAQLAATSFTKPERQTLIDNFTTDGWLTKSSLGYLTLGTRTILELQFKLKTQYEGYFNDCDLCKTPVTQGFCCNHLECEARYHIICLQRAKSSSKRCPSCLKSWSPCSIGPPSSEHTSSSQNQTPRRSTGRPQFEDDAIPEPSPELSPEPSPEPNPPRKLRRRR